MTPPVRMRNDPAFREHLGCDLANEALALEGTPLPELRARLVAASRPPPPPLAPPGRWWPHALGTSGVLLAGLAGWWFTGAPETPEPVLSVQEAAPGPIPLEAEVSASIPLDVSRPARVAASASRPRDVVTHTSSSEPPTADVSGDEDVADAVPPVAPVPPGSARGDLAEQNDAFERAKELLADGAADDAREGFGAYLARWPEGAFAAEARFGQLRANARIGAWEEVEAMAQVLVRDPELADRRDEIRSLHVEALVRLERCDEATALAGSLPRSTQTLVRRSCR